MVLATLDLIGPLRVPYMSTVTTVTNYLVYYLVQDGFNKINDIS